MWKGVWGASLYTGDLLMACFLEVVPHQYLLHFCRTVLAVVLFITVGLCLT